jgi:hypothetical protein
MTETIAAEGDEDAGVPVPRRTITIMLPERGRRVRWTAALSGAFLDHLARTGNIRAAAEHIGVDHAQVYYRQRTNAAFADAWRAALDAGCLTIKAQMIAHILSGGDPAATDTGEGRAFDWTNAMRLLTLHEQPQAGRRNRGGRPHQVATREESDAVILQRLAALARRKQREAAA